MLVFTIVFTVMMPNNTIRNYPIFVLCGILPWNYFNASVMSGIHSVVGNGNLVKKVYFPREVLPIATVLANLVNFLLALVVLFAMMLLLRVPMSPWLWLLPVVIIIQTCFVLGITFIVSALQVFYRDVAMVMDVGMLAWFFLTPVIYPTDILPRSYQFLGMNLDVHRLAYILNPMASLITNYRDLLYSGAYTNIDFFLRTAVTAVAVLLIGYWIFVRLSGRFGEEV